MTSNTITPQPAQCAAAHIDITPIRHLHRGGDGNIAFATVARGDFRNLFSVRASELEGMLPLVCDHLLRDGAFSVNGFYRGQPYASRTEPRLPGAFRKDDGLRYLNAAFIDLDYYKSGLTEGQVLGRVHDAVQREALPPVSLYAFSGAGLWLFWLLRHDRDADRPVRAFSPERALYGRVQRAIADALADLVPDARDASRLVRVPGSENTHRGRRVAYHVALDSSGRPFTYTLDELSRWLGVERPARIDPVQRVLDADRSEAARKGWLALQANRLRQFDALRQLRGRFREGVRNNAGMLYAHFLTKNNICRTDVEREVERFGRQDCVPPLRPYECRAAVKSGVRMKTGTHQVTNARIADLLLITPAERDALETWPAAAGYGRRRGDHELPHRATRAEERQARRKLIADLVFAGAPVPSTREMQAMLADRGHHASHVTVAADYKHLSLDEQSRRRADAEELERFEDGFFGQNR